MMLVLVIAVGICGFIIGSVIQWSIMKGDAKMAKHEERHRAQLIMESLVDQFNWSSTDYNNRSHDPEYSEDYRERCIAEAEIWHRAAKCALYELNDYYGYKEDRDLL